MTYSSTDTRGAQKQAIALLPSPPLPTAQYGLIVADPPWTYTLRETDKTHRGRTPYSTMGDRQIIDLPVEAIAAPDSYCLMWATNTHLPLAVKVLERWGFEYKTTYTWVKVTIAGKPHFGNGHYGRNCTEHFLVGMRGKPGSFMSLGLRNIPTVFFARRGTIHSKKPEEFWVIANRLKDAMNQRQPVSGIELFARSPRYGWDCWGNEVESAA